jgi:hypothetical protein
MFNQAFQKEIPALAEQRQVHYNLLTTFDTFGNALKLTSKKATSNIFDNSFSEQNPKKSLLIETSFS